MRLISYVHDVFWRHDTGPQHPERPARLDAVLAGIEGSTCVVDRRVPPPASLDDLDAVHERGYVEAIRRHCAAGGGGLDPDTFAGVDSWEAALRSAGAGLAAIDALRNEEADSAFLAVRPPGHHALTARAMGFCLFNNIAIAAKAVTAEGSRVAIVDWDVHHGNGTQDTFYGDADVLYLSIHEYPAYPGTGWVDETGRGNAVGATVNLPVPAATGGDVYRAAFDRLVVPTVRAFQPDWLFVSAGYDAHVSDPLAGICLVDTDYGYFAARLAAMVAPSRTVFFLEGGYDLEAITASVTATLDHFASGEPPTGAPRETRPSAPGWRLLEAAIEVAATQWELG